MTIYSGILAVSPLGYFILGSEYIALEDEKDIRNIDNGTIVTYLGEEWITKRLANLNDPEELWMGWGLKDKLQSIKCTMNINDIDKTITRTTGSFLDDGFVPGQDLTISGFDTESNNAVKVIASVTDDVITVTTDFGLIEELGSGVQQVTAYISKRDGTLFQEVDARMKCVLEYAEGIGDEAFYKVLGEFTAFDERDIKEIGIFDAEIDGNLLAHSVFDVYELHDGDSTAFTLALNPE